MSAGLILLIATVLEMVAMAHHPAVTTPDITHALQQIVYMSKTAAVVHGVLIGLMLLIVYGLSEFAIRRGLARPLVRAGAIAYCAGVVAMLGATLVSGFVISSVASMEPHVTAVDLQINGQILVLCGVLNQTCANFAVIAMSAGIAICSCDLLFDASLPRRSVGVLGCFAGAFPAFALLSGLIRLDVNGMSTVVLIQAVWNIAIAVLLMRAPTRFRENGTQIRAP